MRWKSWRPGVETIMNNGHEARLGQGPGRAHEIGTRIQPVLLIKAEKT